MTAGEDRSHGISEGVVTEALAVGRTVHTEALKDNIMPTDGGRSSNHTRGSKHKVTTATLTPWSVVVSRS